MNEQFPDRPDEAREAELIRRVDEGSTGSPEQPRMPISEEVAEEIVVQSFVASQHDLRERLRAENGDELPKRPSLADRLAADRTLRHREEPDQK